MARRRCSESGSFEDTDFTECSFLASKLMNEITSFVSILMLKLKFLNDDFILNEGLSFLFFIRVGEFGKVLWIMILEKSTFKSSVQFLLTKFYI